MDSASKETRSGRVVLLICLGLSAACQDPADPKVSETEIWRLELEQVDDGSTNVFRRRGTINFRLRLNRSDYVDQLCNDPNITNTTFLADVEAIPSRLQPVATGTANGTWNCRGFSADVRLTDGTTYNLISDSPYPLIYPIGPDDDMNARRWVSGARSGRFLFGQDSLFEYEPFDSHIDVRVQNRNNYSVEVILRNLGHDGGVTGGSRPAAWKHRDVGYTLYAYPEAPRGEVVPASAASVFSWPVFPGFRWSRTEWEPSPYYIDAHVPNEKSALCFLGALRQDAVELTLDDGIIECGPGWLGSMDFRASPRRFFLRPGDTDSLVVIAIPADTVMLESTHPGVQATQRARNSFFGPWIWDLAVASNAPFTERGLIARSRDRNTGRDALVVVPVEVYNLQPSATPQLITVARGDSGNATIRLNRSGLAGLDVRLSVSSGLPPGVFLVPPTFSPGTTRGDSSTLMLRVNSTAPTGDFPLDICASIPGDPRERCHPTHITLRVVAPVVGPCTDQLRAWYPLDGNATDASGQGNGGTVQGASAIANRHGDPAAALAFDGVDDVVELGDRFNNLALPFTVAAWVYRPPGEGLRAIFVTDDEPGRYAGIWLQTDGPGNPSITYADGGGSGAGFRRTFTASNAIPSNTWVHVAATVRGATDMTLYVNGAAVSGAYSGTGGPLLHTPAPARIGRITILPTNQPWLGRLDELRVYGCSLDASEVAALFSQR